MPHTYLAVTIGPIVKTLEKARSTKEVWAASYLISYLMKQLVTQFKDTHTFISPLATKPALFEPQGGAGLFPDRLIFKQENEGDFDKLTACIEQTIKDLICGKGKEEGVADEIKDQLKVDYYTTPKVERRTPIWQVGATTSQILTYFQQYLKMYALEITLDEDDNIRQEIDKCLTSLELQAPLQLPEQIDYVAALLRGIYGRKLKGSLLLEDGFGPNYQRPFPSLFEIATSEFTHGEQADGYNAAIKDWLTQTREQTQRINATKANEKDPEIVDPDATLLQNVKTLMGDAFRRRHKYIAIVHGDGDGMGKVNEAIFENRSMADAEALLADVDNRLLQFSLRAIKTIQAFGGCPIYLGGDDVLFFAPVMGRIDEEPASVFDLVKTLSASFDDQFSDDAYRKNLAVWLTLSFGVSISYHKYPMFEALDAVGHLLKRDAKGVAGKNAVAFKVLKNSQQAFGTTYSKSDKEGVFNKHILPLLNHVKGADSAFLTSVQHVLMGQQAMLCAIIAKDTTRLTNFFVNNFDEAVHDAKRTFLVDVANLLSDAYKETKDGKEAIAMAHATLRFVQFLHQPDLDDDE